MIEQGTPPLIDYKKIKGKELLIFPMLVSMITLQSESIRPISVSAPGGGMTSTENENQNEDKRNRWICIVIRDKLKSWFGPDVRLEAFLFDTSVAAVSSKVSIGPYACPNLVSQLLGYISDSVMSYLNLNKGSGQIPEGFFHPLDNRRTCFDCKLGAVRMVVQEKNAEDSSVSMLDHIDKIIDNPQKYLDKAVAQDNDKNPKVTRARIKELYKRHLAKKFPNAHRARDEGKSNAKDQTVEAETTRLGKKTKTPKPELNKNGKQQFTSLESNSLVNEKRKFNVRAKAKNKLNEKQKRQEGVSSGKQVKKIT